MNHEQTQRSISGYLRGELGAEQQRDFLAHTNACPRCSSELAIAARLHRELPQAAPYYAAVGVALPAALAARARASVAGQQWSRKPVGWLDWFFPGVQPNPLRLAVNVLGVFLLFAALALGAIALRNTFQPGPTRPGYQADFTYATQGLTATFTDTTVTADPLTYRWDFGDGGNSNLRTPSHTYTKAGVYTVSMAISGPHGNGNNQHAVQVGLSVAVTASPTSPSLLSATPFLPGPLNPTVTPILPPDTRTPPATDIPSLPGQPTPTLPNFNPPPSLLPRDTPLPLIQPTALLSQPSPTPMQLPNNQPSRTPAPQPSETPLLAASHTPLSEPTSTPQPQPSATLRPEPSATPLPQWSNTPRPEPSNTPEATYTPDCGFHCAPTSTPVPPTPEPSNTPVIVPSNTPQPTYTPQPTHTPHPGPTGTLEPQPTCTPHAGNDPDHNECSG
jgi:PKD repeat protein